MSEDLLYTNKFIIPGQKDLPDKHADRIEFRKFYESRYGQPAFRSSGDKITNTSQMAPQETAIRSKKVKNAEASNDVALKGQAGQERRKGVVRDEIHEQGNETSTRTKIVCLDSRDRDMSLYPTPASFRVYLGEKFSSVRKIRLVSTELPNTEQLIKSQPPSKKNNKMYWQNGANELDPLEIYSITITPGNYTAGSFATELTTKTSAVQRNITTATGEKIYSDFDFVVDNITNTFTMRQNNNFNLDNPISTVAGSTTVTVNQDQHNLLPGQLVNISGSNKVGGVPTSALNASQVINVFIEKVDNLYRVSNSSNKATYVVYGTTNGQLDGRINATIGSNVVDGLGTNFFTLKAGQVINIGYHNYVVQNIVSASKLTVEGSMLESFDSFNLIANLTPNNTNGIEPVTGDTTRSKINVIKTRLRNINFTSATDYANDQSYEDSTNDLSLQNYKQMQNMITVYDRTKTYSVQVPFSTREPKYQLFNYFTVGAQIQNFNITSITSGTNLLKAIDSSGNTILTFTLPTGTFSTIQVLSLLTGALPGWEVSFDNIALKYYFKPPVAANTLPIVLDTINDYYHPGNLYELDFTTASSCGPALGFPSVIARGNCVVASAAVSNNTILSFDNSLNTIYVLTVTNTLAYKVSINRTTFNSINDLISLINSTFLSRGVPITVSYIRGMSKVVFVSSISNFRYSLLFKKPSAPLIGIGDVLGFNINNLHPNNCISSFLPVNDLIDTGYYRYSLSNFVNAVPLSTSVMIKGLCKVTNTSNQVTGLFDTYDYASSIQSNLAKVGNSANTVTGAISGNKAQLVFDPPNLNVVSGHVYFYPKPVDPTYSPDHFLWTNRMSDGYIVTLNPSGHYQFQRRSDGKIFNENSPLICRYEHTLVFDLRQLPPSTQFKLSTVGNGPWNGGSEMIANRRYMFNGQFMQITMPSSIAPENNIYYYDNLSQTTVSTNIRSVNYYLVDLVQGYIKIGSATTGNTSVQYTTTPILNLEIGNVYVFDYTPLVASSSDVADILKISTTIDGPHFFGSELTDANYITFGTPQTNRANQIIIDLSPANLPFPDKLFYYMKDTKGAGGAGYFRIKYKYNAGVIRVLRPETNRYNLFAGGPIIDVITGDTTLMNTTDRLIYSPFNGLHTYTPGSNISIIDLNDNSSTVVSSYIDVFSVTLDNNRFVLHDLTASRSFTITLPIGDYGPTDIAGILQSSINDALRIVDNTSMWNVVFDGVANLFTFIIQDGHTYEFIFTGLDTNSIDLYNSSAELLGFEASDPVPDNRLTLTTIQSTQVVDFNAIQRHTIKISASSFAVPAATNKLSWGETIVHDADSSKTAVFAQPATMISGSRFMTDLSLGNQVLLGADNDMAFTVTNILDDYNFQVDTAVSFIASTITDDGTVVSAPSTVFLENVYVIDNNKVLNEFLLNEKFIFFSNPGNKSVYDYDGRLTNKDLTLTRISPIKLSIVETDQLLERSLNDVGNFNYTSILNHDLYYIKNDSKYSFETAYPATSTVYNKGGNPISVGTGVKFRLLLSNSDTPGTLLGFPNVGNVLTGDTEFRTVQSNTVINSTSHFNVLRSEIGTGAQQGHLRVLTEVVHNFEFGDTVYIDDHAGSSNDLAVNNDEGNTITLVSSDLVQIETENGVTHTRGVFYIPLSLTYGGKGGVAYKKKLFRPFALAGDNYVYLTSPQLESLSTTSTVKGVFAKLLLDAPPGAILFNSFVTSAKVFDEAPLPVLEYFDLNVIDLNGSYFDFNNIDWSASFEITYASQTPGSTGISSRTMERNDITRL